MPRVLLNFDHHDGYHVHFIQADGKTGIGPRTRYYHFADATGLRAFVLRCDVEDIARFDHSLRAWGRGSSYVNLTDEQYARLQHDSMR